MLIMVLYLTSYKEQIYNQRDNNIIRLIRPIFNKKIIKNKIFGSSVLFIGPINKL